MGGRWAARDGREPAMYHNSYLYVETTPRSPTHEWYENNIMYRPAENVTEKSKNQTGRSRREFHTTPAVRFETIMACSSEENQLKNYYIIYRSSG